ncbi:cucumisin-like [Malus domestica]|uniref:cucumisin-like n=1 Tax=Malus domestica TaxID=3750 RepID=UPI003976DA93
MTNARPLFHLSWNVYWPTAFVLACHVLWLILIATNGDGTFDLTGGTSKYFGLATGTPKGGVPNSRISVYKVCWASGCASADILAAFDDAIPDGVDIISTSLGSVFPLYYLEEPIAIGSFPTMKTRTVDRKFVAKAVLGNGEIYNDVMQGNSVNNFDLHGKIVFCEAIETGFGIVVADGAGAIMADSFYTDSAFNYPLPTALITIEDGQRVLEYIRSTE